MADFSQMYFKDYFMSFISIYSTYTMDTFPDILLDSLNQSYNYLIYFIPFFSLALWFLMPLPTAIIFKQYKEQRVIFY